MVGRAFARAVKQELRASQQAAEARQGSQSSKTAAKDALTGMSVQVNYIHDLKYTGDSSLLLKQ